MPRITTLFGESEIKYDVPVGSSIHDFMVSLNPDSENFPVPVIALEKNTPILRKDWKLPLLDSGRDIFLLHVPKPPMSGGGSSPVVGAIMMVIGALMLWNPVGWAMLGTTTAMMLAGTMVGMGAMMLAGSFLQPKAGINATAAQNEEASPTFSLNAQTNQPRLLQVIPEGFGRMQVVPDVVAYPYFVYANNNAQYVFQVFGCGRGLYQFEKMAFGGSAFWESGNFVDSAYVQEDENIVLQTVNVELVRQNIIGPFTPISKSSKRGQIVISLPEGMCSWAWSGDAATGSWSPRPVTLTLNLYSWFMGNWRVMQTLTKSMSTPSPTTVTFDVTLSQNWQNNSFVISNESPALQTITNPVGGSIKDKGKVVLQSVGVWSCTVEMEIVEPGQKVTLFPDNVETSDGVGGQELIAPNMAGYAEIGPFPANPPGTTTTRIQLDIVLPRGLGRFDTAGKIQNLNVTASWQYQQIDDNGKELTGWQQLYNLNMTMNTSTPQRLSPLLDVSMGRYQVKAVRISTHNDDGKSQDTINWEALRAYLPGTLIYDQTVVAVKTKATNAMSKSASERFTTIQTRKLPIWNSVDGTWSKPAPTRSFAAAVSWVAKCDWGGRLPDERIDLATLDSIDRKLQLRDWTFDAWIDSAYLVMGLVLQMCQSVQVLPRLSGSVLTFAFDEAGRPMRHIFTPHDIIRGSFRTKWNTFSDNTPDDVIVSYPDQDLGFSTVEVQGTLPNSESRTPKYVQLPMGIVSRKMAHDYAIHLAACNRYRRIGVDFSCEKLARILFIGDVVGVSHPRLRKAYSGRVSSWSEPALMLELDSTYTEIGPDSVLYMTLVDRRGAPWGPVKLASFGECVASFDKADYQLLLSQGAGSPFTWITAGFDRQATVWILHTAKQFVEQFLVEKISSGEDGQYNLSLINDAPEVYATEGAISVPQWQYRINYTQMPALAAVSYISVTFDSTLGSAYVNWLGVVGASRYSIEMLLGAWQVIGDTDVNYFSFISPVRGIVRLRVSAYDSEQRRGPAGEWTGEFV